MKPYNARMLFCLAACLMLLSSCKKIGEKVENYDLFGLDQASEAIKVQEQKIKAARDYEASMRVVRDGAYDSPNIISGQ